MAEILLSMQQYHVVSGHHCNFYFAGYHEADERDYGEIMVSPGNERKSWAFNYDSFNRLVHEVEENANWEYSGGADLILVNGVPEGRGGSEALDWDSTLPMNLDEMKNMGAITNCDMFFQQIFRYARRADAIDPAWGFSDAMGKKAAGSVLWGLILTILPAEVQKQVGNARYFARQGRRSAVRRRR